MSPCSITMKECNILSFPVVQHCVYAEWMDNGTLVEEETK
ncbi:hypothetical protein J2S09_000468 [Bacillus fengqiuensis]|nr:hypothetical protein [Bacillus fengqiuensis]